MINARTRFVVDITRKLSAAPDNDAKLELIEELSENLYSRYQDMVQEGMPEPEAYQQALGELGDVNELLAYLKGARSDGAPPRQEAGDLMGDLLQDLGGLVQETVTQAQNAMDGAAAMVQDAADQFQKFRAERRAGWTSPDGEDGFVIPSEGLRAIDIGLTCGDVAISFDDNPSAPVRLAGDMEELQVRTDENGLLSIRRGKTASSMFFFLRALCAKDIELILPRQHWESIRIVTASGDVDIEAGLVTDRLYVKTASGDLELCHADCGALVFQSASGDFDGENIAGSVRVETLSGDISLSGMLMLGEARCATASGDITVWTGVLPGLLELSSKSGDCEAAIPDSEGFSLKFHTVSGGLRCDFPLTGSVGRRSGEGVYLDGGTAALRLSSVSGDVILRRH